MQSKLTMNLLAVVLVAGSASFANARALDQGGKPWLLRPLKSEKELQALPDTVTVAMACAKCQSITMLKKRDLAAKPGHGQQEVTVSVHQCPGCGGQMTRKQGTKDATWVHSCTKCGDGSAFCCATKADEKEPTKGMESSGTK